MADNYVTVANEVSVEFEEVASLSSTDRGSGGFGSTGAK